MSTNVPTSRFGFMHDIDARKTRLEVYYFIFIFFLKLSFRESDAHTHVRDRPRSCLCYILQSWPNSFFLFFLFFHAKTLSWAATHALVSVMESVLLLSSLANISLLAACCQGFLSTSIRALDSLQVKTNFKGGVKSSATPNANRGRVGQLLCQDFVRVISDMVDDAKIISWVTRPIRSFRQSCKTCKIKRDRSKRPPGYALWGSLRCLSQYQPIFLVVRQCFVVAFDVPSQVRWIVPFIGDLDSCCT